MPEIQPEVLLDLTKAKFSDHLDSSVLVEGELQVKYTRVPLGHAYDLIEWLDANRMTLQDPKGNLKVFKGLWRSAYNRVVEEGDKSCSIVTLFRRGFADSLDWSEARLITYRSEASNDTEIDGIDDTKSDEPETFLNVKFPNLNPFKLKDMVESLGDSVSDITIEQQTFSGLYHKVIASSGRYDAPDGAGFIDVVLARPQYTLEAYDDFGTADQRDRYYLWNVPKDLAQKIINDWKSSDEGRSAAASYSDEKGLVDLVLSKPNVTDENFSITNVGINCDTSANYHFVFGYNKEQIEAWAEGFDAPPPSGTTRNVDIDKRNDGLFDGRVIETVIDADNPQIFTTALVEGTKRVRTRSWGWNVLIGKLNEVSGTYASASQGTTTSFQVTREDDCTFDYIGEVATATLASGSIDLGSDGVAVRQIAFRDAAAMGDANTFSSGRRKSHSVSSTVNEDETFSGTITEIEEQLVVGSHTIGDVTVSWGRNADSVTASASADSEVVGFAQASGNPDGTVNFLISKRPLYKVSEDKSDTTSKNKIHLQAGDNQDAVPSLTGKRLLRGDIRKGENGKISYGLLSQDVDSDAETGINAGAILSKEEVNIFKNQNQITGGGAAQGVSYDVQGRLTEDGVRDYIRRKITTTAETKTFTGKDDGVTKEVWEVAKYARDVPDISGNGEYTSININDDQTYNYIKKQVELSGDTSYVAEVKNIITDNPLTQVFEIPRYKTNTNTGQEYAGKYMYVLWYILERSVTATTTATFSLSPLSAQSQGDRGESRVELLRGELWVRYDTTVTASDWSNTGKEDYKLLLTFNEEGGITG